MGHPTDQICFALLQYPIDPNPGKTIPLVMNLLKKAGRKKPHYIVLPEMYLGGPKTPGERKEWSVFYNQMFGDMQRWCRSNGIGCFFSQLEKSRKKYFNTAYLIERDGQVCGHYRKNHLFSLGGETKIFSAGSQIKPFQTWFGLVGCVICYDIRFPELIRKLPLKKIKCLIVPAQWPAVRRDHWLTLLKARAIENQCYVVAVNRLGQKENLRYAGDSVVIDPWGQTCLHLPSHRMIGFCKIDLPKVKSIRQKYPFIKEISK